MRLRIKQVPNLGLRRGIEFDPSSHNRATDIRDLSLFRGLTRHAARDQGTYASRDDDAANNCGGTLATVFPHRAEPPNGRFADWSAERGAQRVQPRSATLDPAGHARDLVCELVKVLKLLCQESLAEFSFAHSRGTFSLEQHFIDRFQVFVGRGRETLREDHPHAMILFIPGLAFL